MSNTNDHEVVAKYLGIIREFIEGDQSAADFSIEFMDEFIDEESDFSDETYQILQSLFTEAESYCEDPELRDDRDIGEDELRDAALNSVERLEQRTDEMN